MPFGEVLVDQNIKTWDMPYKFNGKALDEETGLYYYGARYYDPRTSVWLGVDPLAEKNPNISSYVYCANNPVIFVDPDGKELIIALDRMDKKNTPLIRAAMKSKDESGVINIWAHANRNSLTVMDGNKKREIKTSASLDAYLNKNSTVWK